MNSLSKFGLDHFFKLQPLTFSFLAKVTGTFLTGSLLFYIGKVWFSYGFFKKLRLKTPKYKFFYGNLNELIQKGYSNALREWTGQLGKTYGIYEGHFPILITSDLELLQDIFIKKFNYFSTRKEALHIISDEDQTIDLFTAGKNKWKRMRTIMNPTFTSNKIKQLLPLMNKCSDRLFNVIDASLGEEINISEFLDRMTMDTLCNCAFGIDIDPQNNPNDIFMQAGINHFKLRAEFGLLIRIKLLLHEFRRFINRISKIIFQLFGILNLNFVPPVIVLVANINRVLEKRLNEKIYKNDYAQLLIDTCSDDFDEKTNMSFVDTSNIRIEKKLSHHEVKANLVLFLLAGFETTSSALSYCIYVMAKYPNEMAKLQQEIDAFFPTDNLAIEPNSENVQKLTYLDMFFKEVLRMYPIGNGAMTRRCVEPITLKNINFPVGLTIAVDVLSLHYSDEYWHNPNEFNPSRFQTEEKINPLVYIPFGIGPRICIGIKFAQLEAKLTLVKMLRKYDILACEQTPQELEYLDGIVRRPKHGIPVVFKRRKV